MRPVAAGRSEMVRREREALVGEERFGPVVGDGRPFELEEQERRRDRGAAFFDLLHQRAAGRIGGVDAEVEPRVVVGPPDDILQLGEPRHERGEHAGIERAHTSARGRELPRDHIGSTEQRVDTRFAGFRQQRLQVPDDPFGRQVSRRHVDRSQPVRDAAARRVRELRRPHGVARYRLKPRSRRAPRRAAGRGQLGFRYPPHVGGIVARDELVRSDRCRPEVEDHVVKGCGVVTGALDPPGQLAHLDGEAGLLPHLAGDGVAQPFAELDPAAGRRPASGAHSPPPPHEQETAVALDDRADGHFDARVGVHVPGLTCPRRAAACASRAHAQ